MLYRRWKAVIRKTRVVAVRRWCWIFFSAHETSRERAYCACSRCRWWLFALFSSRLSIVSQSFLPLSGRRLARYILQYCLKEPLNPKQPNNLHGTVRIGTELQMRGGIEDNSKIIFLFLNKNLSCYPSLEPYRRGGGSNDGSQNIFLWEIWLIVPKLSLLPLLI